MDLLYPKHKKLWAGSGQSSTPKRNIHESRSNLLYGREYERRRVLLLKLNYHSHCWALSTTINLFESCFKPEISNSLKKTSDFGRILQK